MIAVADGIIAEIKEGITAKDAQARKEKYRK